MPKCPLCKDHVSSEDLTEVGVTLACSKCMRPKLLEESNMSEKTEEKKDEGQPVVRIAVDDIGKKNYKIKAFAKFGGLSLEFDTTVDEVRDFFTKRREERERTLKSVK